MAPSEEEKRLVQGLRENNQGAWDRFYAQFTPFLQGFVQKFLRCNAATAEDEAQEVVFKFKRKLKSFREDASLKTFLTTMARNHCIDYLRQKPKEQPLPTEEHLSETRCIDLAQLKDNQRIIWEKGVAKLDTRYAILIRLRFFDGLELSEIAEALDIPLGTVKSGLHRSIVELRHLLRPYFKR